MNQAEMSNRLGGRTPAALQENPVALQELNPCRVVEENEAEMSTP